MIELERHIEILLLDNDCVIVPGLGGFIAHHIDARFDDRDNTFLPPMRMLGFNSKLNMNDSLLAQSYVEAYDISYPEALNRIDAEVDELKQTIERDGFYELNDIGVLTLNADGNYEFEPCESGVLTPGLYGLAGFEVEKCDVSVDVSTTASVGLNAGKALAVGAEDAETLESNANGGAKTLPFCGNSNLANKIALDNENSDRTISIKVSLLRNVFAVACAIVAFFLLATPISSDVYENGKKISSVSGGLLYNLIPKDGASQMLVANNGVDSRNKDMKLDVPSEAIKSPTPVANSVKEKNTVNGNDENNTINCSKSQSYYCIVMAARITRANAEAYVSKLHSKGYAKARVLEESGESIKVVYGEYANEAEAFSKMNELRDDEAFEGCWVYHVK